MSSSLVPGLSRRELLRLAAALGVGIAAAPLRVHGQVPPGKHPRLLIRSARPLDLETPTELLDTYLTPNEAFFVRSHMLPPVDTDESAWRLAVDGEVAAPLSLSVGELKRFPATTITATLECAGNGRAFFDPAVAGIQWRRGAVGTARWTGVPLADLLTRAGARSVGTHVWMGAADRPLGAQPAFVRQVPIAKATADTLVVYAMNDRPLPGPHGFPLRMIVPGWEGAYSMKWLNRLTVATREHDSFWVASAYRFPVRRVAPGAAVDAKDMAPLTGLAVKSLITRPLDGGTIVKPGRMTVAGFAWAGEGDIEHVDVSVDAGASWRRARLTGARVKYAWRRFELDVDVSRPESYTILSRATDQRGVTQPIAPSWNPSGYLWNAPDQVQIEVRA